MSRQPGHYGTATRRRFAKTSSSGMDAVMVTKFLALAAITRGCWQPGLGRIGNGMGLPGGQAWECRGVDDGPGSVRRLLPQEKHPRGPCR